MPLSQFVLLDYGGGSGFLSLFAKELRIGTVIYADIYDIACRDAEIIGKAVGIPADHYVNGDIDDIKKYLHMRSISCDAVASHDVIEHIYDLEVFFSKLYDISDKRFDVVMATGANSYNPLIKRRLMKKQNKMEYENRFYEKDICERDTRKSYLDARREIILQYSSGKLAARDVELLARTTRGKIKKDIIKCVDDYLVRGDLPVKPEYPTNTCDPYTGNWEEHLIDFKKLKKQIYGLGYTRVDVLPGFYGSHLKGYIKWPLQRVINALIYLFREKAILVSPFVTVLVRRE